jgi:hypothetical protein
MYPTAELDALKLKLEALEAKPVTYQPHTCDMATGTEDMPEAKVEAIGAFVDVEGLRRMLLEEPRAAEEEDAKVQMEQMRVQLAALDKGGWARRVRVCPLVQRARSDVLRG